MVLMEELNQLETWSRGGPAFAAADRLWIRRLWVRVGHAVSLIGLLAVTTLLVLTVTVGSLAALLQLFGRTQGH
jgi:hypothetical protein